VPRLLSLAAIDPDDRVLDVGTGTGIVPVAAARHLSGTGKVVGVDLSEGMLATARNRAADAGASDRIEFRRMDAEALDLPDCSFDVVVSLFALLHFPAPLRALEEMRRVLRPGGRVVVAIGSRPPLWSVRSLVHYAGRVPDAVATLRGKQLTGPGFMNSLVERFCPPPGEAEETSAAGAGRNRTATAMALVRQAGFTDISWHWQGHQFVASSVEEFWDVQRTFSSIARKRVAASPPQAVESLRQEFIRRTDAVLMRGGRLVYPFAAFYVAARRPIRS
jgi:ubiquinone/menaquinone biosynthesis C-methylase UbiE